MGLLEGLLGRRRLTAARRVGVFMAVALTTSIAMIVAGGASNTPLIRNLGFVLLFVALVPLFFVFDLVNTIVFGFIRSKGRAATAQVNGMRFARQDPFAIDRLGFVGIGDGAAENVAWGAVDGRPMWWFEWTRGMVGREGSYACVLIDVGADLPPLHLTRHDHGMNSDLPAVELESGEFNRAFQVSCADRRFATAFCDAPLMAWLIDAWPPDFQVETRGRHVLLWAPDLRRIPGMGTTLHFVMQMLGRGTGSPERVLAYARELNGRLPGLLGSVWPATAAPLAEQPG